MMRELKGFTINIIDKLSPSQYQTARSCPFKLVLARAFDNRQLLPLSPNAHLGSVLHKMIELITKGVINDEAGFESSWKEQVSQKEQEMIAGGSGKLTPIKYCADDFALKKLKVKNLVKSGGKASSYSFPVYKERLSEKKFSDESKKITGIVDLIIEEGLKATIVDFKTGNIFEGELDETEKPVLKAEYEAQLKIYAYLYYLNKEVIPDHLFVVTLDQQYHEVVFTLEECRELYNDAVKFIDVVNKEILSDNFASLANCAIENCKFCGFRPACHPYHIWVDENYRDTRDLKGTLSKVSVFGNGTVGIELKVGDEVSLINGLDLADKDRLDKLTGLELNIYNLKKNTQSINATANSYTVIYA